MKKTLLLLSMLSLTQAFAQLSIHGVLADSIDGPIPGATVMIVSAQDSILKGFASTHGDGAFTIKNITEGNYIFKASFFGYQPYSRKISLNDEDDHFDIGTIYLKSKTLNTVTVDAEYVPIQIKGDTIEYDSRAFEIKQQDMLEDLLKQLPGVEVDADGGIKAQGKSVDKITIDGQEFFADDPKIATKNIPADAVKKVQVYDKKSEDAEITGDDGAGDTKEINIKLKEDKKKGWLGNLDIAGGTGFTDSDTALRYKGKANAFYFKDKWQFSIIGMGNNINENGFSWEDQQNFAGGIKNMQTGRGGTITTYLPWSSNEGGYMNAYFGGININYFPSKKTKLNTSIMLGGNNQLTDEKIERETYFSDSTIRSNDDNRRNVDRLNNRANISLRQEFDTTQVLRIGVNGWWNQLNNSRKSSVSNFDPTNELANTFNTELNADNIFYQIDGFAGYKKKFKKDGRYTTFDLDYSQNETNQETILAYTTLNYLGEDPLIDEVLQRQGGLENGKYLSGNWLYSEPLGKRSLIQVELEHSRDMNARNLQAFDVLDETEVINTLLSTDGNYLVTTNNAGLKHKYIGGKLKTTAGTNFSNLSLSGDSILNSTKRFNYLLPYGSLTWEINKNLNFYFRYKTKIDAPTINQLQPVRNNTNPSEIVLGNTELNPEYSHNFSTDIWRYNEFNFTYISFSLDGSLTNNNIINSQTLNELFVKEIKPENVGESKRINSYLNYGFSIFPIKTKFRLQGNGGVYNGLINLNGVQDEFTSYNTGGSVVAENINKKHFDLSGGIDLNFGRNVYAKNVSFNRDYFNYNYFVEGEFTIKDRWVLGGGVLQYFYPGFETDNQIAILHCRAAVNLGEKKKLQLYLSGNDLLNQNTGFSQRVLQNIFEQERSLVLSRYIMLGVKYSFEKLSGKKDKSE